MDFYLFSYESVRFSKDVTTFRVSKNDPIAAAVLDHFWADLAWNQKNKDNEINMLPKPRRYVEITVFTNKHI
jgi:hypothetical protein